MKRKVLPAPKQPDSFSKEDVRKVISERLAKQAELNQ